MTTAAQAASETKMISVMLEAAGIKKAAIIDNAFDAPKLDSIDSESIGKFWGNIERESEKMKELEVWCPGVQKIEQVDVGCLGKLWEHKDSLQHLKPAVKSLFGEMLGDLKPVESIENHLKNLNLDVIAYGNTEIPKDQKFDIIFLDYYMGDPSSKKSVRIAKKLAMELYGRCKCSIILMSDRDNVEAEKDDFRNDTDLLQGLFDFVPKNKLSDEIQLYLKLDTWARGLPNGHKIQSFFEALEDSFVKTKDDYLKIIRGLSLADYAFISKLSLQPDGQPLGDYMLSLSGAFITHTLRNTEAVKEQRAELDKLEFDNIIPFAELPSSHLAKMYKIAVSDPEPGELKYHPQGEGASEAGSKLPALHMGDIFSKDRASEVYMVINAECDLTGRKPELLKSIHLIPGKLKAYEDKIEEEEKKMPRTELFENQGKSSMIIWDHNGVITWQYKNFERYLKVKQLKLLARLRLPFALNIKQKFTENLVRVGTPVGPPIFEVADIEIYYKDNNENAKVLGGRINKGAILSYRMESDKVVIELVFNGEFVSKLMQVLAEDTDAMKMEKLDTLRKDSKFWINLKNEKATLSQSWVSKGLNGGKVKLYNKKTFSGAWGNAKELIALNIVDHNEPSADSDQ